MLDADEIILQKDHSEIRALLDQKDADAWMIPRFNWVDRLFGKVEVYPDYQARLFRNYPDSRIRYVGSVHETLNGFRSAKKLPITSDFNERSSGLHIHHTKLFRKTSEELAQRERLYRKLGATTGTNEPLKEARALLLDKLWAGSDPFAEAYANLRDQDLQGWSSDHAYLREAIEEVHPRVIVEVGVWKGASTLTMAQHLRDTGAISFLICVDTWLGSSDHWLVPHWFENLKMDKGYPTLYRTFQANVISSGLQDYVIPLPMDSANAAQVLSKSQIAPVGVIHLDGAHDYDSVTNDLKVWWPLLSKGGILLGDDYHPVGDTWPDVRKAFQDFFQRSDIQNAAGKCLIRKEY
jgi:hypothetical protein